MFLFGVDNLCLCPRWRLVFAFFLEFLALFQAVMHRICFVFCGSIHLFVDGKIFCGTQETRKLTVETIRVVGPVLMN